MPSEPGLPSLDGGPSASCTGVVKIYWSATGEVHALKGIDAVFPAGSITAVVGPSGSGKSSLLRILACIDRPTAGQVRVGEAEVSALGPRRRRAVRRRSVGYLFQRPSDNLVPYLTPSQLSGGEQQRVALASAVAGRPALVVADEPTAELDSESGGHLMELLVGLARRGSGFVIATHDPVVMRSADRVLSLRHGALEAESIRDRALSVIDASGRIQLPPTALPMFPDRRAVVTVVDGEVRITPP